MKYCSLTASWTAVTSVAWVFFLLEEAKMQKGVQNYDQLLFCCTENKNTMCKQKQVIAPILQPQISVLMVHNRLKEKMLYYSIS